MLVHALLFWGFSSTLPDRQAPSVPPAEEVVIELLSFSEVNPEPILPSVPPPLPEKLVEPDRAKLLPKTDAKSKPFARVQKNLQPIRAEQKRPLNAPSEAHSPGTAQEPSARPTLSLGMRNPRAGGGEIDVRKQGQLAAAVAAADIPSGPVSRGDLLVGKSIPRIGVKPTWRASGNGTFVADDQPFEASISRDGRIHFKDKPNVQYEGIMFNEEIALPMVSFRFDVTDAVMKSFGDVLYPYRKFKLMDGSRDARIEMAARYQQETLQDALLHYKKHLSSIWRNPKYSLPQRKKILFSLWDECAEKGPESLVRTARSIRATTLRFIRKNIPEVSDLQYSSEELQVLNKQRQSKARFAPYR